MDAETKQKWEILGEEYPEVVERLSQKLGLAQVVLSRSSETSKDQKMVKRFLPDEIEVSDPYWFEEGWFPGSDLGVESDRQSANGADDSRSRDHPIE